MAVVACTIALGTSLSPAADLGALQLAAIVCPPAWDAAPLSFQISADAGVSFHDFMIAGKFTELLIPNGAMGPLRALSVAHIVWPKNIQIKLRSGRPTVLVNQTAARTFSLLTV